MKSIRIFSIALIVCLVAGCVTGQTAWQYYDECATLHSGFEEMMSCGKQARQNGCIQHGTCSARGNALVQYADSLVESVKTKELTEAEAKRKWIEYRLAEENAYTADVNASRARRAASMPIHTTCTRGMLSAHCTTY